MKKLLVLLTGLMMISSFAMAQIDPGENSMGIYFDTNATVTAATTVAPFQSVSAYLCVANPTSAGISGWECFIDVAGADVARSWANAGGGLNIFDPLAGMFNVGVGLFPLALTPVNNVVVLATYTAFIMSPVDQVTFSIAPFPGSVTFDNAPGYVDGDNVGLIVPCGVSTGYPYGGICATINVPDFVVVPNQDMTWSGVKTLFN